MVLGPLGFKRALSPFKTWSNLTKSLSINVDFTQSMSDFPLSIFYSLYPLLLGKEM